MVWQETFRENLLKTCKMRPCHVLFYDLIVDIIIFTRNIDKKLLELGSLPGF